MDGFGSSGTTVVVAGALGATNLIGVVRLQWRRDVECVMHDKAPCCGWVEGWWWW